MIIAVKSINEMNDMFSDVKPMDFSGMGLMEAAHYCQEAITESWNDLKVEIMSEEYKYLYENGKELMYVEEEDTSLATTGSDKGGELSVPANAKNKASVVEKIKALIGKFVQMVGGLINKAMTNIRAHAISASTKVSGKTMMSKKQFDTAAATLDANGKYQSAFANMKTGFTVDPFKLKDQKQAMIIEFPYSGEAKIEPITAEAVVKQLTRPFDRQNDAYLFTWQRVSDCVYNGFKAIGKGILDLKKDTDKKAKDAIRACEKAQVAKLADIMDDYKQASKHNIAVVSGMLTVWNIYARECRMVVNFVSNHSKVVDAAKSGKDVTKTVDKAAKNNSAFSNKMNDKNDKAINGKKLFREKKARGAAGQE